MTKPHIQINHTRNGHVVSATINRAEKLNALGARTFAELFEHIGNLGTRSQARVLLITGSGDKAFCAGADIDEVAAMSPAQFRAFCQNTVEIYRQLRALPQIVVAAVNGVAFGAGCALVMASDIVLAHPRARFAQPEIKVGFVGGAALLPRHVSRPRLATEMVLLGKSISAAEALDAGLVTRLVDGSDLTVQTETVIDELLEKPAGALALAKQALVRGVGMPSAVAAFETQQDLAAAAFALPECRARMEEFLARSQRNADPACPRR